MNALDKVFADAVSFISLMDVQTAATMKDDCWFEIFHTMEKSRKYIRVVRCNRDKSNGCEFGSRSAAAFIDADGNIYMAASYGSPAKNIRGNIYNDNGLHALDGRGFVRYLRG